MFLGALATILPLAMGAPLETATNLHPRVLDAMKRDLGLDAEQATARVAREISATQVIDQLRTSSGKSFAGSWVSDHGNKIHVAVTDKASADKVKAAGATPTIVNNSLSQLKASKVAIDKLVKGSRTLSTTGVASWYVDIVANKVVLESLADNKAEAKKLAAEVGLSESEFEVRTVKKLPKTFIQGGEAYFINGGARCSVGFAVDGGFVSAGHCGTAGSAATDPDGNSLGSFASSNFPGADMAFIEGASVSASVSGYGAGDQAVEGNSESPIGSSICRSGSTTQVHCGEVQAYDVSVNYAEGTVDGLTQTNVCAEPGDSGGSFYTGGQAQGVTSGGSGDCSSGGQTFFQPLNPILETYGLTLSTA